MRFPPPLAVGARVWTEHGYHDHGPLEGPKVNVSRRQGGVITATEKPYYTMDHLLYTVRWDNGQISKHYAKGLFCIGRFQTRKEFKAAIQFDGDIHVTLGPQGGFRGAEMKVCYDGTSMDGRLYQADRDLWLEFLEPLAKRQKAKVQTTKLTSARRR
jgi:hypothetical protein